MKPVNVRSQLMQALRLDLIGPENGTDLEAEILPQALSRWYLTGFLVPLEAAKSRRATRRRTTISSPPPPVATRPMTTPRPAAGRTQGVFPLFDWSEPARLKPTRQLRVEVNWGDYRAEPLDAPVNGEESPAPEANGRRFCPR